MIHKNPAYSDINEFSQYGYSQMASQSQMPMATGATISVKGTNFPFEGETMEQVSAEKEIHTNVRSSIEAGRTIEDERIETKFLAAHPDTSAV